MYQMNQMSASHDATSAVSINGNSNGILHLISKLLLLVIISGLFTLVLIVIIIIRVLSDQLSHWPQTIQSVSFALDIFSSMLAIYSQFGFGQWTYKAICWKCHMRVFKHCANMLPGIDPHVQV